MASNYQNNSNSTSPAQTKAALEQFKYEVASEIGVPLQKGYNGQLSSREAGKIGGQMVKKMIQAEVDKMGGNK
ncbi:MAG: alpha/beta-type small acid-soluble spore protein [Lachnospirales bacterium]